MTTFYRPAGEKTRTIPVSGVPTATDEDWAAAKHVPRVPRDAPAERTETVPYVLGASVRDRTADDYAAELRRFERMFGRSFEEAVEKIRSGDMEESDLFREWAMAHEGWRLATGSMDP